MAHAFRSVASATISGQTTGNKTLTITKPAGTVNDDVMVAIVSVLSVDAALLTAPAGWTSLGSFSDANSKTEAFRKVAASEGASYAFTVSGGDPYAAAGIIASYSGVTLTPSPIDTDAEQSNAASTSATAPSVTPTGTADMLVCCYSSGSTSYGVAVTSTPPSGMTERADAGIAQQDSSNYSWFDVQVSLNDVLLASAVATGTKVATLSDARANTGFAIALSSAAGAAVGVHMVI